MKAVGIIAEYNPFHNGHSYQIAKIKEMFPEYPIIVVMSGNFTERGEPAIVNKWERTKVALQNGVDLVVELPFPFATASADLFAKGAITILNALQISHLAFGSETNDLEAIQKVATIQIHNETFDQKVKATLKTGISYPKALATVTKELTGYEMKEPNDILGVSYVKEIILQHANITPLPIKRTNAYHSKTLPAGTIASATSIRHAIAKQIDVANYIPNCQIKNWIIHKKEDYFPYLKYQVYASWQVLDTFHGVDKNLAQKIQTEISKVTTINELIQKIKTKNYTYQRLSRALLYILCGYRKEMATHFQTPTYIRILGFTERGKKYLHDHKNQITLPIVSRYKELESEMLALESQVTNVYQTNDPNPIQEYQTKPIYEKETI